MTVTAVRHGRLVDLYAERQTEHGPGIELVTRDVLIGYDIEAVQPKACTWFGVDSDSLNPRLLIQRPQAAADFERIVARLTGAVVAMTDSTETRPMVVPRDAAIELQFDHDLPVDLGFFAELDATGRVVGSKNLDAVRIVRRGGAPNTETIPVRLVPRGARLLVDPLLVAAEANAWQLAETGAGLPQSDAPGVANLELQLSVGRPTSLPGLRLAQVKLHSEGFVLPFRAGCTTDDGGPLLRGYAASGPAPRLLGALTMYLERVDDVDARTQQVTLFKNGLVHDIDTGDGIRLFIDNSGIPVVVTDIIADPVDDRGLPAVGHVRALVTRTAGLRENDPRRLPNYPSNPRAPDGERWLVANAPRAVLMAEFMGERQAASGLVYGDDARYFVQWSPAPLANADGTFGEACDNVSPFAGAVLRFTRPVDPSTVRPADSLFVATRDVLGAASILEFVQRRGMDPNSFDLNKYRTPHLVAATANAADGSNTVFRLQPPLGLFLDAAMRQSDEGLAFADRRYRYFLHLVSGPGGIADSAGVRLDLQYLLSPRDHVAVPFALDMRRGAGGTPRFADNHVASVVRRFASRDEDEQPSYYLDDELQRRNTPPNQNAYPLEDVFGAVNYVSGRIEARATSRVRKVADDLNQPPTPPQASVLRHCPLAVSAEGQVATPTALVRFGQPIQNPTNPFGCRLQTLWREIDLGLSRIDPFDFNLDVEAMYWGVATTTVVAGDEFPQTSVYLGHSEARPEPCIGATSALPTLDGSGLDGRFADNYLHNRNRTGTKEDAPAPHAAVVDRPWRLDASLVVREPNNINRFLPMPTFKHPNFVWRDEQVIAQGGNARLGSDVNNAQRLFEPYIISPFLQGQGRYVTVANNAYRFNFGAWSNAENYQIRPDIVGLRDTLTGGGVGAIALPLLADVWVEVNDGVTVRPPSGANGWQIALTVQSSSLPAFRTYSSGNLAGTRPRIVDRFSPAWQVAERSDNSLYWSMVDLAKSKSVLTAGFVEILDPHRMPDPVADPRLGPYFNRTFPAGKKVVHVAMFDPPLERLPVGTRIEAEYRGAGAVDLSAWRAQQDRSPTRPDAKNFPLDPLKAGDAHIRKNDTRLVGTQARNWWTYLYNKNLTSYVEDANQLSEPTFVNRFAGPNDVFGPDDVRYVNWRLVLHNSVGRTSVAPRLDSFMLAYRFESR